MANTEAITVKNARPLSVHSSEANDMSMLQSQFSTKASSPKSCPANRMTGQTDDEIAKLKVLDPQARKIGRASCRERVLQVV